MESKSQEISSIFERFRHYLITNDIQRLQDEFNEYRTTWTTNKFLMFLTNALVVMRTWADHQQSSVPDTNEDWDVKTSITTTNTTADTMRTSAHYFFIAIVDYLQSILEPEDSDCMLPDEADIWRRIITNRWTMNEKFYRYLVNQGVRLPGRLTRYLHNDMYDFYMSTAEWSSSSKILLIELGFTHLLIPDNVFLGCNHILSPQILFTLTDYLALAQWSQAAPNIHMNKLITSMNTPEKMSIFLDFYPNVDVSELIPGNSELYQQRTPLTMLDRLLRMEPYYYETIEQTSLSTIPNFTSDHSHFRAANMLQLFKKLICNEGKFSISIDGAHYQNNRIPLFVSTLGFYLLSLIRFRDTLIFPIPDITDPVSLDNGISPEDNSSPIVSPLYLDTLNENYIHYLIKRASTFTPIFRSFFFTHLHSACPSLHTPEFLTRARSTSNTRLRGLYDELIEQNRSFLTLKQRCRLLIKQSLNRFPSDLERLIQLPLTLRYYASFELLNPNFTQMTLETLTKVGARRKPEFFDELQFHEHGFEQVNGHNDWEDGVLDVVDEDLDDDEPDHDDMAYNDDGDLFDEEGLYSNDDDVEEEDEEW